MPDDEAEELYERYAALRDRMNEVDPDEPGGRESSPSHGWLREQPDEPTDAKRGFRSTIEGLWCLALGRLPLWYLIDNDRRITNEVAELQYFLGETMHSLAGRPCRRARRRGCGSATPVTRIEHGRDGVRGACGRRSVRRRPVRSWPCRR